jgi:hypothetical protein
LHRLHVQFCFLANAFFDQFDVTHEFDRAASADVVDTPWRGAGTRVGVFRVKVGIGCSHVVKRSNDALYDAFKGIFILPSTMWFVWLPNFFSTLTFIVVSVVSILAIPNALKNRRGFGWLMVGGGVAFVVSTPVIWGDGGFRAELILLPFIIPFFLLFFAATIQRQAIARLRDSVDLCCRPSSIIARSLRPALPCAITIVMPPRRTSLVPGAARCVLPAPVHSVP